MVIGFPFIWNGRIKCTFPLPEGGRGKDFQREREGRSDKVIKVFPSTVFVGFPDFLVLCHTTLTISD